MSKHRKHNRRKHRHDKRYKIKKQPVNVWTTEKCDGYDEIEEEILDLLKAPGAMMGFFDEKGEFKIILGGDK